MTEIAQAAQAASRTAEPLPPAALLAFLLFALAISGSVAIFGRRALHILFFGQRAVREVSEGRVLVLRGLASLVAVGILGWLIQWAVTGVAP